MSLQFADRLNNVETSAIRELFKLLGKPGIISFAGGFPDSAMFDVDGIRAAVNAALTEEAGGALQYGATEGYGPLREQLAAFMTGKGCTAVAPENLIVTTGSQQALDLLGKTLISPGDKVIVEGPTFLATIQCFRLYGAELISAPIDGNGVKTDELEKLIVEHKPKFVYLIPTFGNPSGAMLSLERRKAVLEMAVKHQTLIVEDDPYGDLYFGDAPPPSPAEYGDAVRAALAPLTALGVMLLCEPGRVIVGQAGALVASVVFRKTNEAKHFTIIDGAMNDLMRPALYGSFHPMWPVAGGTGAHGLISTRATITTDVVGPICETGDFLGRDRTLPELARGELLAIGAAGAYGAVMSSNYNTRPRAPEILVAGTNYTIVRKRETLDQLIANEDVAGKR